MEIDEAGTVEAWRRARTEVIDPVIARHEGRIVKLTGDGFLAEFATAENAVKASLAMQEAFAALFEAMPADRRVLFRMGINLGDIWVDAEDIYGADVNVAARLESVADPGGVCISGAVRDAVKHKIAAHYEDCGLKHVKNVSEPIHVWSIRTPRMSTTVLASTGYEPSELAGGSRKRSAKRYRVAGIAVGVTALAAAGFYASKPSAPTIAGVSEWTHGDIPRRRLGLSAARFRGVR
jgi:adenylate cyclase